MDKNLEIALKDKFCLNHKDIMEMFNCGQTRAYGIIKAVKLVSDTLHIAGRITTADFLAWFNEPINKRRVK